MNALITYTDQQTGQQLAILADGSVWSVDKTTGKPWLVCFPETHNTPELRQALYDRQPSAAAAHAEPVVRQVGE